MDNKELFIKICILLIIIILLRFLYKRLTDTTYTTSTPSTPSTPSTLSTLSSKYNNVENFAVNDKDAIDLLSKIKNNDIITAIHNLSDTNVIKPWTTKLYNTQTTNTRVKPLALYQPQLLIKDVQYCKLGDILCQNSDYSLPDYNHFTLLIKKSSSDIKPPEKYDLVVNFGDESVNTDYYYYEAFIQNSISEITTISTNISNCSQLFNNINSTIQTNIDSLKSNLNQYIIDQLIVKANQREYTILDLINRNQLNIMSNEFTMPAGVSGVFLANDYDQDGSFNYDNTVQIEFSIPSTLDSLQSTIVPTSAKYTTNVAKFLEEKPFNMNTTPFINITKTNISLQQFSYPLINLVPIVSIINTIKSFCNDVKIIYQNNNIMLLTYLNLVDKISSINTILSLINTFTSYLTTYSNLASITLYSNPELITYITPILNVNCGTSIIGNLLNILNTMNINYYVSLLTFTASENINTSKLGIINPFGCYLTQKEVEYDSSILAGPRQKNINYSPRDPDPIVTDPKDYASPLPTSIEEGIAAAAAAAAAAPPSTITTLPNTFTNTFNTTTTIPITTMPVITTTTTNPFLFGSSMSNSKESIMGVQSTISSQCVGQPSYKLINTLNITSFDNDFFTNLPQNSFNILLNQTSSALINTCMVNINSFASVLTDVNNNVTNTVTIKNLPLKIYNPIPPKGYLSLGHIFCNLQSQLPSIQQNDKNGNGVCCVPENCVKEVRDWNSGDKIFEYNKDNVYWAIYYNPYTGTFISTNTNQLPSGKVCKVIACVKKCSAVDELQKADDCIRNYYNMNKKYNLQKAPDLVADVEEEYYLDKVKAQSDIITKLYKRANTMQLDIDKATIVNAEMNKNKLQNYVDTQKRNIDIVTKRLDDDSDKNQTNVNVPLDVLNNILRMIQKNKNLSQKQKTELVSKLINNKNMVNDNLITNTEYEENINKILSSCPEYDLTGLVKKNVVSNVCYGCPA